jgi:hypothetical protein
VEFVKIVLGGLAGVIIAQLILWWLPGDLRRDPFGLAPRLPTWLQWLRPDELGSLRPPANMHSGGMADARRNSLVQPARFGAADAPTSPIAFLSEDARAPARPGEPRTSRIAPRSGHTVRGANRDFQDREPQLSAMTEH